MARFILSRKKVIEQYNKVKEHCDIVSYSSKTNQDVTTVLEEKTDAMFSIHFENELKHVKDMSRILFLSQAWTEKQIGDLIDKGVNFFVVDNETDLKTLENYLENHPLNHPDNKISLLLRLKLKENTIRTEKYFVFGMDSNTVNKHLIRLKNNNNIENLGIHFHRKTQNMSEWDLLYELKNIIHEDNWNNIDIVNIGGGIPSNYANTNENVLGSILRKINELREFLKQNNARLIIEPGRFIAAPSAKLETTILSIDDNNITVDASVYNSDMDAIIVPVKLLIEGELPKSNDLKPYVIKGMTPCSLDLFRYRVYLAEPKTGDKLFFLNAGAYNFTSDFCDLEKLKTVVID